MAEKIKGYVKWFSNRSGYGFITPTSDNAPTTDDIFVHQSSIVNKDGEYRTLKEGFETQFEVLTDDAGKLKAVNVTSADGSPCPGPEPRKRRPKKSTPKGDGDVAATSGEEGDKESGASDEGKGKAGRKPRRRNRNGKKESTAAATTNGEATKKEDSWETKLDDSVQESLKSKKITVNGGRAFLAVGDARIKLGTDGYAALAHSKAVLAEGTWTVLPSGVVTFKWERVLKLDGSEWSLSTADGEKDTLVAEIKLVEDSVQPTTSTETTATLWGEDKADPKDALEKHGFSMRKMILNADQAIVRRRRGRGNRFGNKKKNGKDKPASTSE
ncbi:cold shock transcription antiterminator [Nitzschia inconspicua]|uniref:Cold shock transcription antiterminator n=1 Tax=Nitzschia inconspicua TaxID=303405 RepID=A0A9K3LLT0_9STRA|nr:cold shock transcription antiterminator [Nitzschia inconspicua]